MPTMDAWEFIDNYNAQTPKKHQNSKLILLTTSLSPGDKEKIKNYPTIKEVLLKPLDTASILTIIEKYFGNSRTESHSIA